MTVSEAQKKATIRFERKTYDRVLLRFRKDEHPNRDEISEAAAASGESLNGYIKQAVRERMERGY